MRILINLAIVVDNWIICYNREYKNNYYYIKFTHKMQDSFVKLKTIKILYIG